MALSGLDTIWKNARESQHEVAPDQRYQDFKKKYKSDRVNFARNCIRWDEGRGMCDYQEDLLRELDEGCNRLSWRGPRGARKCVAFGERVRLSSGELVDSQELIGKSFEVLSVGEGLTVRKSKAFARDNGVKTVVEITTDKGSVIRRTENHPLWADKTPYRKCPVHYTKRLLPEGSWVDCSDLEPGNLVAAYLDNSIKEDYGISDAEIKLAGYILGDGGVTGRSTNFSQQDGVCLEEMREISGELGCTLNYNSGVDYRIVALPGGVKPCKGRISNPVRKLLNEWDIAGKNAWQKSLPSFAWLLSGRQLSLLISRLFACDGWAHTGPLKKGKTAKTIGFCSVSRVLACDVQTALKRLGIHASLRRESKSWTHGGIKKTGHCFTVSVSSAEEIIRFSERIGIFGKEEAVDRVCQASRQALRTELGRIPQWRKHNLPENMRWEKVKSVRLIEEVPTVAITVPGDETFLTDYVEHNTSTCSIIIIHHCLVYSGHPKRTFGVATTASVGRQLTEFLWPEVHKWISRIRWDVVGRGPFKEGTELMTEGIRLQGGKAFAFVSNDPDKIEGFHADDALVIFDESKAVPEESRKRVMASLTTSGEDTDQKAIVIAVSTPGAPSGWFYDIHRGDPRFSRWTAKHITQEMCIKAGALSREGLEELKDECGGEHTSLYKQQGLGEFSAESVMGILPLEWVEKAQERGRALRDEFGSIGQYAGFVTSVGYDISGTGKNRSALIPFHGLHGGDFNVLPKINQVSEAMAEIGRVGNFMDVHDGGNPVLVSDANGLGAGYTSKLMERASETKANWTVQGFMAQGKVDKKQKFPEGIIPGNARAAMWLMARYLLNPDNGFDISLPPDSTAEGKRLKMQLVTMRRLPENSAGATFVLGKEEYAKEHNGESTDEADACLQALTAGRIAKKKKDVVGFFSSLGDD